MRRAADGTHAAIEKSAGRLLVMQHGDRIYMPPYQSGLARVVDPVTGEEVPPRAMHWPIVDGSGAVLWCQPHPRVTMARGHVQCTGHALRDMEVDNTCCFRYGVAVVRGQRNQLRVVRFDGAIPNQGMPKCGLLKRQ